MQVIESERGVEMIQWATLAARRQKKITVPILENGWLGKWRILKNVDDRWTGEMEKDWT